MPERLTPSLREEEELFTAVERATVARSMAVKSVNPAYVTDIEALHETYPYLPAGVKASLGAAGVKPDDPMMQQVSENAVKKKKKKGFGFHSFGDALKSGFSNTIGKGLEVAGDVLDPVTGAIADVAKPVIRTGFMALQAPIEEGVGLLRNVAVTLPGKAGEFVAGAAAGAVTGAMVGAAGFNPFTVVGGALGGAAIGGAAGLLSEDVEGKAQWTTQSQLGIATGRLIAGKKVDTGEGFFVGHDTALFKMQADRARSVASLVGPDGKRTAWTPGRSVANVVAEPGSTQHKALSGLIDGYLTFKADPSALAMAKRAKVVAARKTINPEGVAEFLAGKAGDDLAQTLSETTSSSEIRRLFNGQLDDNPEVLVALMDESDPAKIKQALAPLLGAEVSEIPKFVRKRSVVPRLAEATAEWTGVPGRMRESRLMADVPTGMWEFDKPAEAIKKFDNFLKIGKVSDESRAALNDKFVRSLAGGKAGRLPVLEQAMEALGTVVREGYGASDEVAAGITRLFKNSIEDARHYTAQVIGEESSLNDIPFIKVAGDKASVKSPHDIAEFLNHGVPIPDMQEVTRTVSTLNKVIGHPLTGIVQGTADILDPLMSAWKRMAILRAAYMPRVVGEEQVRLATAGYDSMFRHPFSFIAGRIAHKKGVPVLSLEGVPLTAQDDVAHALNVGKGSEVLSRSGAATKYRQRISVEDYRNGNDRAFLDGWKGHELDRVYRSPLMSKIAEIMATGSSDAGTITNIDELKQAFNHGKLRKFRKQLGEQLDGSDDVGWFDNIDNANLYIDSLVERVTHVTRNDPTLLEAGFRGLDNVDGVDDAMRHLVDIDNAPPMVVGDAWARGLPEQTKQVFDKVTDFAFDYIARKPTNFFSREPVLEQSYWQNVERMLPAMSDADKAKALKLARESKLPKARIAEIEKRATVAFEGTPLGLDEVHDVAAAQATRTVKGLLYDMANRKQWAQASRLVFPFAEAWQEMMVTWSKLLVENPVALRRGQQVVEGARGAGFFHTDQYGQEVFTYPGSEFLTEHLVGAPIPIHGQVAGLNLFANSPVLPGFGPVAQIAASTLLPEKPEFDWVQQIVSPYGRGETGGGFVESFLPSWAQKARKALTSGESDRVFNNTVYDMAKYLMSTGRGDISTVEGQEQLTQDSISMAKRMYVLRTLGSFALPSAPSPEMVAADKDGRVMTQFAIFEEYRAMQKEPGTITKIGKREVEGVGWENAPQVFLETFGEDALLLMQPKTKGGGPPLEDTLDWVRDNPGLAKRYKEVYQFFAPSAGDFSMTAYERQIATGERETLTPDEAYELANGRIGQMKLRQARAMLGPKPTFEQKLWLNEVKQALIEEHPGFVPEQFDPAKTPKRIRELEQALEEPELAKTETGQALTTYMEARKRATETVQAAGIMGFNKAKAAAPVRQWLREVADALIEEHPAFAEVWDMVLSREMVSDDEVTAEVPQ